MITIDARWINTSGMGTYLRNLLPGVIAMFPKQKFCLLGDVRSLSVLAWTNSDNVSLIEASSPMYSLTEQLELIKKIPKETQLYWASHYNIPVLYSGDMLVTFYDLFHLAMPKLVGGRHKRFYAKLMFHMVRWRALAIITISQFSKDEFWRFIGPTRQSIIPIHLGVAKSWFDIKPSARPYSKKYILFVGNIKPHKNLSRLVKAFNLILNRINHDLVIVGKKEGFITGDTLVADLATRLGSRVEFTGYVDDAALHQYFAHAEVMVFPSLYEGFGLPPLEAMAAGCPVLVSNVGPMPEVCGDAALYCDPYNVDDIAQKLFTILNDDTLRETLRQRGLERAHSFTWDKCIAQTCDVISGLMAKQTGRAS
jgi:glycosyltransferase involved in cell wall biosynthesis